MPGERIILFDGVCNLCNNIVVFVIKRDPGGKFRFASLQSPAGQNLLRQYGLSRHDFNSFVYIRDKKAYLKSTAALQVLHDLGGIWKASAAFRLLPLKLRDFFYDLIAKSRYRVFGKQDSCMIPTPALKKRFLE
ncbi:MAG TPA: thiol-disulfide oxidoreductase DCC family protein [Chitinophagaceae bacterium]|jgi:predicted DCC family thiol-disulfide oxidoreductase YuxK|nr:thiol-disulfide oxidoreductase DCC family protein [Chitinophagaceae bacterium]